MADLKEIIEGVKKKERKYQDLLYSKYSGMLFGICLRYTKNRFEAEDVMQEGFVKIYKNIGMYSQNKSFEGWIRRIMINTAITNYRKNQKHAYHDDVTELPATGHEVDEMYKSDFTKEELMNVINALPPGYKMVFNLYVIEGYKHKEIADIMDIDINTSKSQLSRAKKYLQRELKELSKINL